MKISSFEILEAVSNGDGKAVYDAFCKNFNLTPIDRIWIDTYPSPGKDKIKYAILWQNGYAYSWKATTGWEDPVYTELDINELLIRT